MSTESVQIPGTLDEAVEALGGLGRLITARKWERAAIVAAFVRLDLGSGGRDEVDRSDHFLSAREFAEKKIVGLSSHVSVAKYVQAWLDVHDGKYPKPGAKRVLPTVDFPPMRTGTDGHSTPKGMTETVGEMIERHGAEAVATAVADVAPDAATEAVVAARGKTLRKRYDTPTTVSPPTVPDALVDLNSHIANMRWEADQVIETLTEYPSAATADRMRMIQAVVDMLTTTLMEHAL